MIYLIALITMLLDHIGLVFFPGIPILRFIGRLSFPLFAWGVARGYKYTRNLKMYATRLLLLGAISQIPYYFLLRTGYLNICFTLLAGLITLMIYDSDSLLIFRYLGIIVIMGLSQLFHFEYGFYGILTIFLFYRFWGKDSVIYYQFILTLISIVILRYDASSLIAAFSPIIILSVQLLVKRDLHLHKALRYSFYPVHLFILLLIKIGGV